MVIGSAIHVEDCVSVLSNSASNVLDHLDLISHPPEVVLGTLPVLLPRMLSYRISLPLLPRMAHKDVVGQVYHDHLGGDADAMTHRSPDELLEVGYDEVSL